MSLVKLVKNVMSKSDSNSTKNHSSSAEINELTIKNKLKAIWEELLGVEDISFTDNFISLNGDSILASMVISRIKDEYAVELPIQSFLDHPTIDQMSKRVCLLINVAQLQDAGSRSDSDSEVGTI